ncbi:MAG: tetratricopeptide repeat protein [Candidatus Acidiferrales bacterium]
MLKRFIFLPVLIAILSVLLHGADVSTAALIEKGHFKRAQTILSEQLKSNPNNARSHCEMSQVDEAFQRWDEAIQQAEKAVSIDGKNAEFQAQLADAVGAKLSAGQGGFFERASLARRFKKEAEAALQLDPNNVDANSDLAEFYLEAPGIIGGDNKKAEELADRVVKLNAARGYLLKIEIFTEEKRSNEIEPLLQQAIKADSSSYDLRIQAANFYIGKGSSAFTPAEEQAKQAIHLDPERVHGYTSLAVIYTQQSRWKDLESLLADSQREVPDDFAPLYQSARTIFVHNQTQELVRAEKYLRAYLGQPPEGNEPGLAAAHWRLGLILEKEGHKDQARQEVQQAVNLDPNLEPARKDLKRLR